MQQVISQKYATNLGGIVGQTTKLQNLDIEGQRKIWKNPF